MTFLQNKAPSTGMNNPETKGIGVEHQFQDVLHLEANKIAKIPTRSVTICES
jgi:hypothetical protein